MAKSHWHGALRSTHKSCTRGHESWKKGGGKRELVAAHLTSSRQFSRVVVKIYCHWLLRACLLGSQRKLPPPAFLVLCGLQFPCTVYIYNQGPLSSTWAHCISCASSACSHCRRCCCCQLQCDRWRIETRLQEVQARTTDHDLHLSCIYSQSFFLHCLFQSQEPLDTFLEWFNDDNKVICIEVFPGDSRVELMRQCFKHNDEEQCAEYRTMMKSSVLSTEPWWTLTFTSNSSLYPHHTDSILAYIPCTSPHQMTFWGTQSNAFSRSMKAMLSLLLAARYFSCSCLTTKITSVVPLPGMKPNWELSIDTVWWDRPQSSPELSWPALSAWDSGSCPFPMNHPYPCRGRQWNYAPSRRIPCHREWLQLWDHGSGRCPYHRLLILSPPLCLMGPVLCLPWSER